MKHPKKSVLTLAMSLALATGCSHEVPPPQPLSAEELPAAVEKAYSQAPEESKNLATQLAASVRSQDYAAAHTSLQELLRRPNLTPAQTTINSRALLTVNNLLQSAQEKGDEKAAEAIKTYQSEK